MYTANTQFNTLADANPCYATKIKYKNSSGVFVDYPDEIYNYKYNGPFNPDNGITIGTTGSASVSFSVWEETVSLEDVEIEVWQCIKDTAHSIPIGVFKCLKSSENAEVSEYTAYDRMTYMLDRLYSPADGLYNMRDNVFIQNICTKFGFSFIGTLEQKITIVAPPKGYTYRQFIGYMASLRGANAFFNREGNLEFKWYKKAAYGVETAYRINHDRFYESTAVKKSKTTVQIGVIRCTCGYSLDTVISSGTSGMVVNISNPYMTQELLDEVLSNVSFAYTPMDVEFLGDFRLDVGDIVRIGQGSTSVFVPIMHISHESDGGIYSVISSYAQTEGESQLSQGNNRNNVPTGSSDASVMIGATESVNGTSGLVPMPLAGQQNLFLRADGKWAESAISEETLEEIRNNAKDISALNNRLSEQDETIEEIGKDASDALVLAESNAESVIDIFEALDFHQEFIDEATQVIKDNEESIADNAASIALMTEQVKLNKQNISDLEQNFTDSRKIYDTWCDSEGSSSEKIVELDYISPEVQLGNGFIKGSIVAIEFSNANTCNEGYITLSVTDTDGDKKVYKIISEVDNTPYYGITEGYNFFYVSTSESELALYPVSEKSETLDEDMLMLDAIVEDEETTNGYFVVTKGYGYKMSDTQLDEEGNSLSDVYFVNNENYMVTRCIYIDDLPSDYCIKSINNDVYYTEIFKVQGMFTTTIDGEEYPYGSSTMYEYTEPIVTLQNESISIQELKDLMYADNEYGASICIQRRVDDYNYGVDKAVAMLVKKENISTIVNKLELDTLKNQSELNDHTTDTDIHVTPEEKVGWNSKSETDVSFAISDKDNIILINALKTDTDGSNSESYTHTGLAMIAGDNISFEPVSETSSDKVFKIHVTGIPNIDGLASESYVDEEVQDVMIEVNERAKSSDLTDHTTNTSNPHNVTAAQVGLGEADNTSDEDKPVSVAQQEAIDLAYQNATAYADEKIKGIINGAPETMDTLEEIAKAMEEHEDVVELLEAAVVEKANQSELDTHTGNNTIHITANERTKWNDANSKKHEHSNKSVLDGITSALVTAWNSAVTHISDAVKHITSAERTAWNEAKTSVDEIIDGTQIVGNADKLDGLDSNDFYRLGAVEPLSEGADLDTFLTPGQWGADTDAIAQTILNKPDWVTSKFKVTVEYALRGASSNYIRQTIIMGNNTGSVARVSVNGVFRDWIKNPTQSEVTEIGNNTAENLFDTELRFGRTTIGVTSSVNEVGNGVLNGTVTSAGAILVSTSDGYIDVSDLEVGEAITLSGKILSGSYTNATTSIASVYVDTRTSDGTNMKASYTPSPFIYLNGEKDVIYNNKFIMTQEAKDAGICYLYPQIWTYTGDIFDNLELQIMIEPGSVAHPYTPPNLSRSSLRKDIDSILNAEQPIGNAATVNGHTVKSDVPANAEFTDTVHEYAIAPTSLTDERIALLLNKDGNTDSSVIFKSGNGISFTVAEDPNNDNVKTVYVSFNGNSTNDISVMREATATESYMRVGTGDRVGRMTSSATGKFGLYDNTKKAWVGYSDANGNHWKGNADTATKANTAEKSTTASKVEYNVIFSGSSSGDITNSGLTADDCDSYNSVGITASVGEYKISQRFPMSAFYGYRDSGVGCGLVVNQGTTNSVKGGLVRFNDTDGTIEVYNCTVLEIVFYADVFDTVS